MGKSKLRENKINIERDLVNLKSCLTFRQYCMSNLTSGVSCCYSIQYFPSHHFIIRIYYIDALRYIAFASFSTRERVIDILVQVKWYYKLRHLTACQRCVYITWACIKGTFSVIHRTHKHLIMAFYLLNVQAKKYVTVFLRFKW